jgi:hypothetical protein
MHFQVHGGARRGGKPTQRGLSVVDRGRLCGQRGAHVGVVLRVVPVSSEGGLWCLDDSEQGGGARDMAMVNSARCEKMSGTRWVASFSVLGEGGGVRCATCLQGDFKKVGG